MADRGYSGSPLAKKIGIKPEHRVVLLNGPSDWVIPDLPAGSEITDDGMGLADVVLAFFRTRADLERAAPHLAGTLLSSSMLWIAWPRWAAGHESDITENGLREVLLPTGLVDVKVAALGEDWSGLKFVWRLEHRGPRG
jgi:hypothetical protein